MKLPIFQKFPPSFFAPVQVLGVGVDGAAADVDEGVAVGHGHAAVRAEPAVVGQRGAVPVGEI